MMYKLSGLLFFATSAALKVFDIFTTILWVCSRDKDQHYVAQVKD
jgi:hypothetical protein